MKTLVNTSVQNVGDFTLRRWHMNSRCHVGVEKRTDFDLVKPKVISSVLPRAHLTIPVTYRCWGCESSVVKQEATDIPILAKTVWNICADCLNRQQFNRETEDKRLERIEHYLILFKAKEYTKDQTAKKILASITQEAAK